MSDDLIARLHDWARRYPRDTLATEAASALAEAQRERDTLKPDAERYQWLRDCDVSDGTFDNIVNNTPGAEWDSAIAAAIAEGRGK